MINESWINIFRGTELAELIVLLIRVEIVSSEIYTYESRDDECMIGVQLAWKISSSPSSDKGSSIMDDYSNAGKIS